MVKLSQRQVNLKRFYISFQNAAVTVALPIQSFLSPSPLPHLALSQLRKRFLFLFSSFCWIASSEATSIMRVSIGIAIVLFNILGFVAGDLSNPPPLNFNATSDTDSPERAALILSSSDKVHLQAGPPPPPAQPPDQASIELWNACVW